MEKYKLYFLGTCACDFSPRLKDELRDRFDKDARRSSALMIGESLLIDCGIHTLESLSLAGKDTRKISDILITHLHRDHYNEENIRAIASGERAPLRLWVRAGANISGIENVEVIEMEQFELLETTACPVSEIALRVGFDDFSHFSKYFKKHIGYSPTELRRTGGK